MRVRRNPIAGHNLFTTYRDLCGNTSLHRAVENHDIELVKFYAEYPQLVNSVNNCDDTPLHYCAFTDFPEAAETLLRHGANINAVNTLNQTPIMTATLEKAYKTVEYLLSVRAVIIERKVSKRKVVQEETKIKVDPFVIDSRELSVVHYALLLNDEKLKRTILREMARRKIFFVQNDQPNWFNPRFITLYTNKSYRKKMMHEGKGCFKWSIK